MRKLAFVTCRERPGLAPDDAPVIRHLPRDMKADIVPWDAPGTDWRAFDAVVLRSTWDYHLRRGEFEDWLGELGRDGVTLWNPVPVVRWNLDKTYLRDLALDGVEIPPTRWVATRESVDLERLRAEEGWRRVVIKPAVAASAWRLFVAGEAAAEQAQRRLEALLQEGGVLIQPLLEEVLRGGEWSLVFLGGELSHAVVKRPPGGEVRVQSEFGGSVEAATPTPELAAWARRCVAAVGTRLLYARVDAVVTGRGPLLMELELIEPQLFLASAPGAAARFAGAVVRAVQPGLPAPVSRPERDRAGGRR